jgi:hypothetical protein
MKWLKTTVPYSFRDCHVIAYADDTTNGGAWLIEHDTNLTTPYVLYRFDTDKYGDHWYLLDTYHTEWEAQRAAEQQSRKLLA